MERFGFSSSHATKMVRFVSQRTIFVTSTPINQPVCRDPDDDNILALVVAGGCKFLVTGDEDLLVLGQWNGVRILRPREFAAALDAEWV